MTNAEKTSPLTAVARCVCGAPARFDHLAPHPTEPIDQFVYRCTRCAASVAVDGLRLPPRERGEQLFRAAM